MSEKFEKHITVSKQATILDCLYENTDFSKQKIKRILHNGSVWLESRQGINRVRRAKKIVTEADVLHLYYDEKIQNTEPLTARLIADEDDYSIWDKPSGMQSQGSKWGDHCALYRYAELNLSPQRPAFIVHRLDRAANGLIIVAHKKTVATKLAKLFETRNIYKKYKAQVEGCISAIDVPYEIKSQLDGKLSISKIVSIKPDMKSNTTEVEVVILTGRKHQIRRHLSELGYPIVGDRLYGLKASDLDLQLSSINMKFVCPVSGVERDYSL